MSAADDTAVKVALLRARDLLMAPSPDPVAREHVLGLIEAALRGALVGVRRIPVDIEETRKVDVEDSPAGQLARAVIYGDLDLSRLHPCPAVLEVVSLPSPSRRTT
jgi:hypothetical protein